MLKGWNMTVQVLKACHKQSFPEWQIRFLQPVSRVLPLILLTVYHCWNQINETV